MNLISKFIVRLMELWAEKAVRYTIILHSFYFILSIIRKKKKVILDIYLLKNHKNYSRFGINKNYASAFRKSHS